MPIAFSFTTTYLLDKTHFSECYDASVTVERSLSRYLKALALTAGGLLLLFFTEAEPYVAWFILLIGIIEALSVYYRKPWWVARQMLSKAADAEVTLTLNEQSIDSVSPYLENSILWTEIAVLEKTSQGWLVQHNAGKNYIASSCLSEQAEEFLAEKSRQLPGLLPEDRANHRTG